MIHYRAHPDKHCQKCAEKDKQIEDLNEGLEDKRRLTKEIDVIINGKYAAKSPSLEDVLKSVQDTVNKLQEAKEEIENFQSLVLFYKTGNLSLIDRLKTK